MSEPFLGTVMPVAFQFAPQGWSTCQGQSMPVNQNSALFSLLGTTFGGNGSTTFNLPDLQGRTIVGQGMLNPTTQYITGQKAGSTSVSLAASQVPLMSHTHTANVTVTQGSGYVAPSMKVAASGAAQSDPSTANNVLANAATGGPDAVQIYAPSGTSATIPLGGFSAGTPAAPSVAVSIAAAAAPAAQSVNLLNPYIALYYCIAINGIYPTRP
jgi:microcystin-dependent protein